MKFTVDDSQGNAMLRRLVSRLNRPGAFVKSWAVQTQKKAQTNARAKGGKRFWADFARRIVITEVTETSAVLLNDHYAANQKQFGGVIEAKDKAALTIPITKEAKGKTAKEFKEGGRKLFVLPGSKGVLGYADGKKKFHALFVLRRRTRRQKADPWMPTDGEIIAIAIREAGWWLEKQLGSV